MGVRPYGVQGGNGRIQVTKINYSEIGSYSKLPKEEVKMCVERMIKHLSDQARSVFTLNIHFRAIQLTLISQA